MTGFVTGVAATVVVGGVLWFLTGRRRRAFWQYVTEALRAIAKGDYRTHVYDVGGDANHPVVKSINDMTRVIQQQLDQLSQERDVLQHILHSMTTGVVYIAGGGRVRMVNEAAERMFRKPAEQWLEREHWAVFGHYHLSAAIDNALLFGTTWQGELKLRENVMVEAQLIVIQSLPRRTNGDSGYDALVLLTDVSEWRRLERMRSEFVANVSHELKTPLASIRGFAETLLEEELDEATGRSFVQTIYDESMRMTNLVSDLLELSKLEGSDRDLQTGRVRLATIVEGALQRLQPQALRRNIELRADPCGDVTVWGDEDKLLQVVLNLASNAIYYTSEGGEIRLWYDILVDRVKVHVTDTGIGIPPEHMERVFERFYRVDHDRSRASGGTGLGLAIVKHIIGVHGGEVGVNSEPGRGSDFWFTLSRLEGSLQEVES